MATRVIENQNFGKLSVAILTSDNDYAQHLAACMECFGVDQVMQVDSLSAAMSTLRRQAIDIIVAEIHSDRSEGLMLPSAVSDLNSAGWLYRIPHILWTAKNGGSVQPGSVLLTAGLEQGWLETLGGVSMSALLSHARLARTAGIHVEIAREGSVDSLFTSMAQLAEITPQSPYALRSNGPNLPGEDDVVTALTSGEGLRVVYQPQYNLQTRQVVGAEALVRWQHPRYGEVSPSVLVSMVSQLGLDLLLFSYIENNVIETLALLDKAGIEIPIAINASAKTICAPGLAMRLATQMHKAGLPAKRLKIGLTENMLPGSELSLSASITALRSKGFPVSLDDFGAGAATLALLFQMPFDEMRIDGTLVRAVGETAASREVISGIATLAKLCNLTLITEGIEDESTISLLNQLGCGIGQGHALAQPMEVNDFMGIATSQSVPFKSEQI